MFLLKKFIIFFIVFAIVANLSLGIFERQPRKSLMAELLTTQIDLMMRAQAENGERAPVESTRGEGARRKDSEGGAGAAKTGSACAAILNIFGTSKGIVANPICQAIDLAWTAIKFAYDQIKAVWDKLEGSLRDIVAKRILDYIVNETVKWIQGGGKPKFIGNWSGFLKDVGDIAFDSVVKDLGLANLCSPFGMQLKLAFLPVEKFDTRVSCTLDKVVKNIQNFYVDFSVGGWEGYMLSWEPNNNLYGAYLLTLDEAARKQALQTNAAQSEAIANKGWGGGIFGGDKICKAGSKVSGDFMDQGAQHLDLDAKCHLDSQACLKQPGVAGFPEWQQQCAKDLDACLSSARGAFAKETGYVADSKGNYCKPNELTAATPGSLIGDTVASAITSDKDWAANIQRWTSALVNAVINRLIQKGLAAMVSSETGTPSRYYPPEYQQMVNQSQIQENLTLINQIQPMQNEWNYLLTQKGNSLVYAREILSTLEELQANNCTSTTGQLVQQSDIDNASSTVDNLILEVNVLQTNLDEAQSVIDQINSAQTDLEKQAAQFALNNFLTLYNTVPVQQQIIDGSARSAASQQTADLLKQLEGVESLQNGVLVNDGLRQSLSDCRTPQTP